MTDKHIVFIHYDIWLLQIFVTRGRNKKYASVLAPGQLDGLKYDFLLYSFLTGTIILCSVFIQVTYALIINHICDLYLSLLFARRICQMFYFLIVNTLRFSIYYEKPYYPACWAQLVPQCLHHASMPLPLLLHVAMPCQYVTHGLFCCAHMCYISTYSQIEIGKGGLTWQWPFQVMPESFCSFVLWCWLVY